MTQQEIQGYIFSHLPLKRKVTDVIIHYSETPAGRDFRAADIERWHKEKGFKSIGYHFVIDLDGTIEIGRPLNEIGAHTAGFNKNSIGICYIGGVDKNQAADTRTDKQKQSLEFLLHTLVDALPSIQKIAGHRDYYSGKRLKECPGFDAIPEYSHLLSKK